MPTVAVGGLSGGINLGSLLAQAKTLAGITDFERMGQTPAEQTALLADIVNRAVGEFLEQNPRLLLTTGELSLGASAMSYGLPATLHELALRRIYYSNTGSDPEHDLAELSFLDGAGVAALDEDERNGQTTADYPDKWGFDPAANKVLIYPKTTTARTLVMEFQQAPTAITAANIATPDAVTIGEVPGKCLHALALRVGWELAFNGDNVTKGKILQTWQTAEWNAIRWVLSNSVSGNRSLGPAIDQSSLFKTWQAEIR